MAADEPQPTSVPIDFEEWAQPKRGTLWTVTVSGFEQACRKNGKLRQKQTPETWNEQFDAWREAPAG